VLSIFASKDLLDIQNIIFMYQFMVIYIHVDLLLVQYYK